MACEKLSERDKAVLKCMFDPSVTIGDVADDGDHFVESDTELTASELEATSLCARAVELAERGELNEALQALDRAVAAAPEYAAAYNDRAQLLRLMKRDDEAMSDLDKAVSLARGGRARALAQCQRGVLLRRRGRGGDARAAFQEAAALGSGFARKQIVEMNPYAALCNQMLSQVMKGETNLK